MAEQCDNIIKETDDLSINDNSPNKLIPDDNVNGQLKNIIEANESIFSWDIRNLTGHCQDQLYTFTDKVQERNDLHKEIEYEFNIETFSLELILTYELYNKGNLKQSLEKADSIIRIIDVWTKNHYFNVLNHIALSTYAYIALSMNLNSKKVIENIKPLDVLNKVEQSALCAIKAYIFIEYPPIGHEIALKYAIQARDLYPDEPEWTVIWLIAKGRFRRLTDRLSIPDESELDAANMLLKSKLNNSTFLIIAATTYWSTGRYYERIQDNYNSVKYYNRALNIIEKELQSESINIKQLCDWFTEYLFLPKRYQSESLRDEIVKRLEKENDYLVYKVLGKYFFKMKYDYKKAKKYLSNGMLFGNFRCTMNLLNLECINGPIKEFPLLENLKTIYDKFTSPARRISILLQILMYYFYLEKNPREIMQYLKLYMDLDFCDKSKLILLNRIYPIFFWPNYSKNKNFLENFTSYVNEIVDCYPWDVEEKDIIKDTHSKFCVLLKIPINENEV